MEKFEETLELINRDIIPQLKQLLTDHAVLAGILVFMVLMMWYGYRRGFFNRMISLGSVIITLAAEIKLFPYVLDLWKSNEKIHEFFLNIVYGIMHTDAQQASSPLYSFLGLNVLADNAAERMGELAARVLCLVLIFLLVRLLLKVLTVIVFGLKKICLINSADKLLGMIFGFAEGILLVWIFMLAVSAFPNVPACRFILDQITESEILMAVYNQNLILEFLSDLFR